jgi:hypothetical protein
MIKLLFKWRATTICFAFATMLAAPSAQDISGKIQTIDHIRDQINVKKLKAEDKGRLVYFLDDKSVTIRHMAVLALNLAVKHGLYPKEGLLKLLEGKTLRSREDEKVTYLRQYKMVLGIQGRIDQSLEKDLKVVLAKSQKRVFSASERTFVERVLSSKSSKDKTVAGELFVLKSRLSSIDRRWIVSKVSALSKGASGSYLVYWRFIRRYVDKLNPQ